MKRFLIAHIFLNKHFTPKKKEGKGEKTLRGGEGEEGGARKFSSPPFACARVFFFVLLRPQSLIE